MYIKKHNTTTVISLVFCVISENFSALTSLFLQFLYSSLVELFVLWFYCPWRKSSTDAMTSLSLDCVPRNCFFHEQKSQGAKSSKYGGLGTDSNLVAAITTQRCGHGALTYNERTPRHSFPRCLLFIASRTLNQDVIYINKYVNTWTLWQKI